MCRILAYVGEELPVASLLLEPENSLINQTLDPELHPLMQLAGWGFGAWSERLLKPEKPFLYRRPVAAFYDDNVVNVIPSLQASTLLAHVRADHYDTEVVLADENCHPYSYDKTPWIMAHNGNLPNWRLLQKKLLAHCKDDYLSQIRGSTDTEFLYLLFLSLLQSDSVEDVRRAFEEMLGLVIESMKELDLVGLSKQKIVLATRDRLIAVNYGLGHDGRADVSGDWRELRQAEADSDDYLLSMLLEPMYILTGQNFGKSRNSYSVDITEADEATCAIIASEPLTGAIDDWLHLEFGQMIALERSDGFIEATTLELNP